MMHAKILVGEKEVLMFFESIYQYHLQIAAQTIMKHLSNAQVRKVFDDIGLVNITNKEVTLFSLDGEMETLLIS